MGNLLCLGAKSECRFFTRKFKMTSTMFTVNFLIIHLKQSKLKIKKCRFYNVDLLISKWKSIMRL